MGGGELEGEFVVRIPRPVAAGLLAAILAGVSLGSPGSTLAADTGAGMQATLTAYLDGRPIPLKDVANYYCDDFSYPVIQCSVKPATTEARASSLLLAAATGDYVTIYEYTNFNGAYMNVSQDYTALVLIGWNDRVSSFKARNSGSGKFWTDWFNTGTGYFFCCNQQMSSLGTFDNTFSSVQRQ